MRRIGMWFARNWLVMILVVVALGVAAILFRVIRNLFGIGGDNVVSPEAEKKIVGIAARLGFGLSDASFFQGIAAKLGTATGKTQSWYQIGSYYTDDVQVLTALNSLVDWNKTHGNKTENLLRAMFIVSLYYNDETGGRDLHTDLKTHMNAELYSKVQFLFSYENLVSKWGV